MINKWKCPNPKKMLIAGEIMLITGILLTLLSMNFNPDPSNAPNMIIFTLGAFITMEGMYFLSYGYVILNRAEIPKKALLSAITIFLVFLLLLIEFGGFFLFSILFIYSGGFLLILLILDIGYSNKWKEILTYYKLL